MFLERKRVGKDEFLPVSLLTKMQSVHCDSRTRRLLLVHALRSGPSHLS